MIRRSRSGFVVPGHGTIILSEGNQAESKKHGGRVAYLCIDVTAAGDVFPHWQVKRLVPL